MDIVERQLGLELVVLPELVVDIVELLRQREQLVRS
jgi:hypothetical protein